MRFLYLRSVLIVWVLAITGHFTARAQTYTMGAGLGTISTCAGTFYDSGGGSANYAGGENFTVTFCSTSGLPIYLQFSQFATTDIPIFGSDVMTIYNGPNTSSPVIGTYKGATGPGTVTASNPSNCLTVVFVSTSIIPGAGWTANIGCGTPPPPNPGTACAANLPFCTNTSYNFPAATNTTAETGPAYGCLTTQPNPVWYYLKILNPGDIIITLANTANVDVDFICWGPFTSTNSCGNLTAGNTVDCSYDPQSVEEVNITGAVAGQYYMLCITNFSNQPTNFTLTTTGSSTGATDCQILCNITAMTATPGACNPANNQHDLTGSITVQYPPSAGTLTISTSSGQSVVINPPFTTNINYTLPGVTSTGGNITVTASFSSDTSCHFTTNYFAASCAPCSVVAANDGPACPGSPVNLTTTVTGSVTNYAWSGPNSYTSSQANPTLASVSAVNAGLYTVTITAGACTATASTTVAVQPTTTVNGTTKNVSCNSGGDGAIYLTGSFGAGANFIWSGGLANNDTVTNLAAATYSVTVTTGGTCSATASFTITEPAAIALGNPTITAASCASGGSITVTAIGGTGALLYAWSNSQSGNSISGLSAGPYDLTVTDANLCTITATYNVPASPNAIVFGNPTIVNALCNGSSDGSITVNASGGTGAITFAWSNTQTGPTINGLAANSYAVTATDANSCTASASYIVTEPTTISFGTPVIVDYTCVTAGSITVNASGGTGNILFSWSNNQNGATITGLNPGNYTVTATDNNLCSATATYTVGAAPNSVTLNPPTIVNVSCGGNADGSITANPSGGSGNYSYSWTGGLSSQTISGLIAGQYSVTVDDGAGCTISDTYTVNDAAPVVLNPQTTDAVCNQTPSGSIRANASGGQPPYTYNWSNGQTGEKATALVAGTYDVTVSDVNGCSTTSSSLINEPPAIILTPTTYPIKCVGDKNGRIQVDAQGGVQPFSYSATQDGANFIYTTNGIIEGLAVGDYLVIVNDNSGCTKTIMVSVPDATLDNFTTSTDSTSCYGADYNDGSAHIIATSIQNGPYQFGVDGSPVQYSGDFFNLSAGAHTITAVNVNGCTSEVPVVILQPLPIVVDVEPDTVVLPLGEGKPVVVSYINASGNVNYAWQPFNGLSCTDCPTPMVTAYQRGDYLITVSQQNGTSTCFGSATLHVDVAPHQDVYVPNTFTPNGDGNNDIFLVYGGDISTVDLKIFNRWGELVYETNNQFEGWDGTYRGQLQLPQVFTYYVNITFLDRKKAERKGTVMLMR